MPYKDPVVRKQKAKERNIKFREKHPNYYNDYDLKFGQKYREQKRLSHVKRHYNLNADEYLQMILDQNNKCAICNEMETWKNKHGDIRPLAIDHDHSTGKVRGLLCTSCNALLGHAKDKISILENAINYLKRYS